MLGEDEPGKAQDTRLLGIRVVRTPVAFVARIAAPRNVFAVNASHRDVRVPLRFGSWLSRADARC